MDKLCFEQICVFLDMVEQKELSIDDGTLLNLRDKLSLAKMLSNGVSDAMRSSYRELGLSYIQSIGFEGVQERIENLLSRVEKLLTDRQQIPF